MLMYILLNIITVNFTNLTYLFTLLHFHSLIIPLPVISDYIEVNITAVNRLCEEAISAGVKKIIHFSSISAVGKFNGKILQEIIHTNQPDVYGLTKFTGEKIVTEYSKKINSIILRPPGIVGEGYFLCWIGRILKSLIFQK